MHHEPSAALAFSCQLVAPQPKHILHEVARQAQDMISTAKLSTQPFLHS
jgi:hypothetical protein